MAVISDNLCSTVITSQLSNNRRVCVDKLNKYLFCCFETNVRIYEIATGECLDELKHSSFLVAVHLFPNNFLQLLTCTVDGQISLWNYEEGTQLKTWNLSKTVEVFIAYKKENSLGLITTINEDAKDTCCAFEIKTDASGELHLKKVAKNVPLSFRKISCSSQGHYLAFVDKIGLNVTRMDDEKKSFVFYSGAGRTFECVVCHPSKNCIATGDSLGKVTLWYDFFENYPVQTHFHWHSEPVRDIAFPSEGSSMYTGGMECVVVKWVLQSSYKQETKEFLARLGGPIVSITPSPDNSVLIIVLEDNSIQIASSQMKITATIRSFVHNLWMMKTCSTNNTTSTQLNSLSTTTTTNPSPLGLRYDPTGIIKGLTQGCLITNGRPGQMQFYNPEKDAVVYNLDIVNRNLPPQEAKTYSEVVHMDHMGNWLATVEYRHDETYTKDFALKFWYYDENTQKLELNTSIEDPHFKAITCVKFRPFSAIKQNNSIDDDEISFVTTSLDGKAKIWIVTKAKQQNGTTKLTWLCDRTITYRNRQCHCCQFNRNGKVLCLAFRESITFWNFDDHVMLVSLPVVDPDDFIKQIEFGQSKGESKLVCVLSNSGSFSVWDVDCQIKFWALNSKISLLCKADPLSGLFAAFSDQQVFYFKLSDCKPVSTYEFDQQSDQCSSVIGACFTAPITEDENARHLQEDSNSATPNSPLKSQSCLDVNSKRLLPVLYFLTRDQKLGRLCTKGQEAAFCSRRKLKKISKEQKQSTSLAAILQESKLEDLSTKNAPKYNVDTRYLDQNANLEILNAPAHTLPHLQELGLNFIRSCLQPKVIDSFENSTNVSIINNNWTKNEFVVPLPHSSETVADGSTSTNAKTGQMLLFNNNQPLSTKKRNKYLGKLKKCDVSSLSSYFSTL